MTVTVAGLRHNIARASAGCGRRGGGPGAGPARAQVTLSMFMTRDSEEEDVTSFAEPATGIHVGPGGHLAGLRGRWPGTPTHVTLPGEPEEAQAPSQTDSLSAPAPASLTEPGGRSGSLMARAQIRVER